MNDEWNKTHSLPVSQQQTALNQVNEADTLSFK